MDVKCSQRLSGAVSVLERVPYAHSVTIGFWFSVGSGFESESERGYSHFVEHMMFKGTESRDAYTLAREAERAGGYLNAFTERECLCVHCTLPAPNWNVAVTLLGDMAFRSVFDPEEFEREKAVVFSEVLSVKDDPEEDAYDEFHSRVWNGHPFSKRVAGEPGDVERIARDDLFRFYKERFTPANLTIAAAGDFDIEEMEASLDDLLLGIPPGRRGAQPTTPDYEQGTWVHPAPTGQVYLVAGMMLPQILSEDETYAMDVLNCALGDSSSSRLFQNIREKQGLCYSIGSSYASTQFFGVFYITAVSSPASFPRLWDKIRGELDSLRMLGFLPEEIEGAISHIYGQDIVAADDTDTRMRALAREWMRYGHVQPYLALVERVRGVKLDGVQHVRDMILALPMSVLAYGHVGAGVRRALGATVFGELIHA